jgi:hypothetical protein
MNQRVCSVNTRPFLQNPAKKSRMFMSTDAKLPPSSHKISEVAAA